MAVVFISPRQRQKMFFIGITIILLVFLIFIFLTVFLSEPKEELSSPMSNVFDKSKVNINIAILDSDQFKELQPFPEMQVQYSYKAVTKNNRARTGFIFAASQDGAREIITNMGLTVTEIKEVEAGRDNPFIPYY